jgi:enoyl-CoA hydratase/carnithine racemase
MPAVHLRVDDGVAVVTLDDPERRNALSATLAGELVATLDALDASDEVGAVVVTGAPPAFCAGADLSELGTSRERGLRQIYEGFLRVARMTVPTIAAVNGAAVGAGMNLALACDVRLAARSARFDTRFLQLGIHPGGGHTWMLRRLVGEQAAAARSSTATARRVAAWRGAASRTARSSTRPGCWPGGPPRCHASWPGAPSRPCATWQASPTTTRPSNVSCDRSCGRWTSPSSRPGWPS